MVSDYGIRRHFLLEGTHDSRLRTRWESWEAVAVIIAQN